MNLGQPVFTEAKDDGSGGDSWSYRSCKAPVKSLQMILEIGIQIRAIAVLPTVWRSRMYYQHQVFFTGRMPFLSPNQQCQSTEGDTDMIANTYQLMLN